MSIVTFPKPQKGPRGAPGDKGSQGAPLEFLIASGTFLGNGADAAVTFSSVSNTAAVSFDGSFTTITISLPGTYLVSAYCLLTAPSALRLDWQSSTPQRIITSSSISSFSIDVSGTMYLNANDTLQLFYTGGTGVSLSTFFSVCLLH